MNGDAVRRTRFRIGRYGEGYDPSEVDDLLRRVAMEMEGGQSARPLIENATFRILLLGRGYDIDAVDWFFGRVLSDSGQQDPAGTKPDPWSGIGPVTQLAQRRPASAEVRSGRAQGVSHKELAEECESAWREFGKLPGTYLRSEKVKTTGSEFELRTADQQAIASHRLALLPVCGQHWRQDLHLVSRHLVSRPRTLVVSRPRTIVVT